MANDFKVGETMVLRYLSNILSISLLTFLVACGPRGFEKTINEEEIEFVSYGVEGGLFLVDSTWLEKATKFGVGDTILWYPLANIDFEVVGPCDSCHGASASYFEFEHLTWMRDSLKNHFPKEVTLSELTPGLFTLQEDHPIDSLHMKMQSDLAKSKFSLSSLNARSPFHDYLSDDTPQAVEPLFLGLKSDLRADYLFIPLETQVKLFPENNEPQGRVEVMSYWGLFDYKEEKLLMSYFQRSVWHSGSDPIDRETTPIIISPMSRLLRGVQHSVPKWTK